MNGWSDGRIIGCFVSWLNVDWSNLPPTRIIPASSMYVDRLGNEELLAIFSFFLSALYSRAKTCCYTIRIHACKASLNWNVGHWDWSRLLLFFLVCWMNFNTYDIVFWSLVSDDVFAIRSTILFSFLTVSCNTTFLVDISGSSSFGGWKG